MTVLIAQNIHREGPGLLEDVLMAHDIEIESVDLSTTSFPHPEDYSAIFVFGGPQSSNDDDLKMEEVLHGIKEAAKARIPYLGVCLGMQELVNAHGGDVYKGDEEIGWRGPDGKYFEACAAAKDPLLAGVKFPLILFHNHHESVTLTSKMKLLATGKQCKNQIVSVGHNMYGIQGHLELTPEMFDEWKEDDPDVVKLDPEKLQADYSAIQTAYEAAGTRIFTNFLRLANLI